MKQRRRIRIIFEVRSDHIRRRMTTLYPANKREERVMDIVGNDVGGGEVEEVPGLVWAR